MDNKWISLWENHEGYEIQASKNFGTLATIYAQNFAEYINKILESHSIEGKEMLTEKIIESKNNNLLVTLYTKLNPLIPELLWVVKNWSACNITLKNIKNKYKLEQNTLITILKSIVSDILHLSIWLKAEWIDENFDVFLDEIEENWKRLSFEDIIDFVTIIDIAILQAVKNHIDWRKFIDWNEEKAYELIDILSLERKRLIEHYLHKYNITNNNKIKILKILLSEENIDLEDFDSEKWTIDRYIKYIIWYRSMELKTPYSQI